MSSSPDRPARETDTSAQTPAGDGVKEDLPEDLPLFRDDPGNPCPEGVSAGYITAADGVRLRYARWRPRRGGRGTISLFQGRTEFIEKYFEVVEDLLELGFGVVTLDWRGQGGSQRLAASPHRGHVRRFADYDLDLAAFVHEVVLPDTPGPHYALGHSLGGHILLRNAYRGRLPYERMVLSAPMLELYPLGMSWDTVEWLAWAACLLGLGRLGVPGGRGEGVASMSFEGNPLTHDEARFERYKALVTAHPRFGINAPSFRWLYEALKSMKRLNTTEFARKVAIPALIIAAGEDRVVSTLALEDFGAQLKAGHTVRIPRASHELMMEDDGMREQFFAAFRAFIPGEPYFSDEELKLIGRKG